MNIQMAEQLYDECQKRQMVPEFILEFAEIELCRYKQIIYIFFFI